MIDHRLRHRLEDRLSDGDGTRNEQKVPVHRSFILRWRRKGLYATHEPRQADGTLFGRRLSE